MEFIYNNKESKAPEPKAFKNYLVKWMSTDSFGGEYEEIRELSPEQYETLFNKMEKAHKRRKYSSGGVLITSITPMKMDRE